MKIENPLAYSFIMPDDLYLLQADKKFFNVPADQQQAIIETQPINFNYLGGYKKNFLIIVHYPATEFIDGKHQIALESVLKRLNMSLDDVAIFNRFTYPDVVSDDVIEFFKPQKLLLMGKNTFPSGMELLALNTLKKLNSCNVLYSFSFGEMMENNDHKKVFWEQMKQL